MAQWKSVYVFCQYFVTLKLCFGLIIVGQRKWAPLEQWWCKLWILRDQTVPIWSLSLIKESCIKRALLHLLCMSFSLSSLSFFLHLSLPLLPASPFKGNNHDKPTLMWSFSLHPILCSSTDFQRASALNWVIITSCDFQNKINKNKINQIKHLLDQTLSFQAPKEA